MLFYGELSLRYLSPECNEGECNVEKLLNNGIHINNNL
jgi:hypothetical protein